MKRKTGFTLVELLVVVLIIGILAAVALPQYQKAVWKSRNTQLKTLVKAVGEAETRYFLENGAYALRFSELDIDLPLPSGSPVLGIGYAGTDSLRTGENFQIVLNNSFGETPLYTIVGFYIEGKYKAAGFLYDISSKKLFCYEHGGSGSYASAAGSFCQKLEAGGAQIPGTNRRYELP